MIKPESILCPSPAGLYCPPGDFYIDPTRPVARAVITHGHSDHARAGHGAVLATSETLAIMQARYGEGFAQSAEAVRYGQTVERDGVCVVPDFIRGELLKEIQRSVDSLNRRERESGDGFLESDGVNQRVFNLVNKGEIFEEIVQHEDVMEVINRLLGGDFILSGFSSNTTGPGPSVPAVPTWPLAASQPRQ